jgi:hypothetical protein
MKSHGLTASAEWKIWQGMKRRCHNPKRRRYERYGGRGISVCDRWLNSFPNFLQDMGPRPEGKQLSRIDNNGDYSPQNCRWETATEQANNRVTNHLIKYEGQVKTMAEWARHLKIPYNALNQRAWYWKDANPRKILFGRAA